MKTEIRRKIDSFLMEWKRSPRRLPLVVRGARQVGKTHSIRKFGASYKSFIEINFVDNPEFKGIFSNGYSAVDVIRQISFFNPSFQFIPNETLIFFDEMQEQPDCSTCLKFFAEDGRFDVICSGSMMGLNYKKISSNSVGYKIDYVMHSLDFEEFLYAKGYGDEIAEDIFTHLKNVTPFSDAEYGHLYNLFLEYAVVGGMPAVVREFIQSGTFTNVGEMQRQLIFDYEEDITKYAEGVDKARIKAVYRHIPKFLAQENKKFQISKVAPGARHKDYWGCVEWLEQAGVVMICTSLDFPELPLKAHRDRSAYKLYMADTGLLVAQLDKEAQEDVRVRRNLGTWKGGLFENIVAEALVKAGAELSYYKKDNSTLEMDFFLRSGDDLVPVEVKSENARAKSLKTLIASDHYPNIRWGVKFVNGNVGFENNVLTLPQWSAFLLPKLI